MTYPEVERVIRRSEVMAVVRALRSDRTPRIGDTLDYIIGGLASDEHSGVFAGPGKRPYRFAVEQWHLDEAAQAVADAASDPAGYRRRIGRPFHELPPG